jgi:hypothetical protein
MRENRIWGDGFVDDDWRELTRVRDWSHVTTDELVRLFPALVPTDGRVPAPIAELVAAQAEAIDASTRAAIGAPSGGVLSFGKNSAGDHARRKAANGEASAADAAFLRRAVSHEAPRDADSWDMARFAYLAGVHPAYVWPQAVTVAAWGATAAWLGALARRGAAYLPVEVAEYIADVAPVDADGVASIRDPLIADLVRRCADPAELLWAVRRRHAGSSVVVCSRLLERRENRLLGPLRRSLRRVLLVRGPAAAAGTPAP